MLHSRWGTVPISNWESVSLIGLLAHYQSQNLSEISFSFSSKISEDVLEIENDQVAIGVDFKKEFIYTTDVQNKPINDYYFFKDAYKAKSHDIESLIKLPYDWYFDPRKGILINTVKNIKIYPPTALDYFLPDFTIPIDDMKSPKWWKYSKDIITISFPCIDKKYITNIEIYLTNSKQIDIKVSSQKPSMSRLTFEYTNDLNIDIVSSKMKEEKLHLVNVHYGEHVTQKICTSSDDNLCVQLLINNDFYKNYKKSFIPLSHRPIVGKNSSNFSLASQVLNCEKREQFKKNQDNRFISSKAGKKLLREISALIDKQNGN